MTTPVHKPLGNDGTSHGHTMKFLSAPRVILAAGLACLGIGATGCMSLNRLAPPVTPAIVAADAGNASEATLAQGRSIYVTRCVACHTPEAVDAHTPAEWDRILPRMSKEAKLTSEQHDAVRAYILAARASLASRGG